MAKFCSNCGNPLDDAAKFCMGCGTKCFEAPQPAQPPVQHPFAQQPPVQQPFAQQPFAQQPQQQYAQPLKKKKSKLPIVLAIVGIFAIVVVAGVALLITGVSTTGVALLITGVSTILNKVAEADYYEMGTDQIPSVKYALGEERKVTYVNKSSNLQATKEEITYSAPGSVFNDILKYTQFLRDNGWIATADYDLHNTPGAAKLAKESADKGKVLIILIEYEADKYVVKITKSDGTLTFDKTAKADYYEMGTDQIPSIKYALGEERKVTDVKTSNKGNTIQKEIIYGVSDSVFNDLLKYTQVLRANGWIVIAAYDLNNTPGSAKLAKESADEGKILIILIEYATDKYVVKITKDDGTLTRNN